MKKAILKSIPWLITLIMFFFYLFKSGEKGVAEYRYENIIKTYNEYRHFADSIFESQSDSIKMLIREIDSLKNELKVDGKKQLNQVQSPN